MHRVTTTTVVGMLALTTGGCSWGGLNSNSSTEQPTVKLGTKPERKPAPVSFQKSLTITPNSPTRVGSGSTGLIELIDGKQYVKQV